MAYLRNNTVNLLNLHYGIHALAMNGGAVFFAAFLLKAGLSPPAVLTSLAAILAGRFVLRPMIVPLAVRIGLRRVVIIGTIVTALQYPILAAVHGIDTTLLALCVTASIGDTLYWTSYHAYFAALGDAEHRGHQISAREALAAIVGIVAPVAGGWALMAFGPAVAFGAIAFAQAVSALPLFGTPDIQVARHAPGALKAAIPAMHLFLADGWIAAGFIFVWQIALFTSLNQNFAAFGGAMALAALAGAIAGLVIGRNIDAGHGRRAVWLAFGALAIAIIARASTIDPATAVIANALGALVSCLYVPTLMTAVYNQAKLSPCPLRFHVATEGAWDAGNITGCLIAAASIAAGAPLAFGILLSLAGAVSSFVLLGRYYAGLAGDDAPAAKSATISP